MTAADTPSWEELLAELDELVNLSIDPNVSSAALGMRIRNQRQLYAEMKRALCLAAKPADDGVREAVEPFVNALGGVPASKSDAAPFARVPNDARTPGTVSTLTFGDLRKLVRALSTKGKTP